MATYRHISHGFDPVFDEDSRVLVLGSFPSVLSRRNDFYYGNPQNRFWRVVAACLGKPTPPNAGDAAWAAAPGAGEVALAVAPGAGEHAGRGEPAPGADPRIATLEQSIAAKRELLLSGGIALWDVIESCDIKGSSDASIKNVVPVDISRVLAQARIGAVVCNGATAGRLYKRYLQWEVGLDPHVLPSTSPANAAWSLDRLTERWQEVLSALLEDARTGKMAVARGIAKAGADTAPGEGAGGGADDAPSAAAAGKRHFMYVLECGDASLYTGYTTDVAARLAAHRAGKGAKYTRNRGPLNLLAQAEFATKHEAMSAEARFKRLSRDQKDRLLAKASAPDADFAEILREELGL